MATQPIQPQSIFPDVPRESPAVNENGDFSQLWELSFGQLFQALQTNFKNEGILIPTLTATQIAQIQAIYNPGLIGLALPQPIPDITGQMVFNITTSMPQIFIITYNAPIGTAAPTIATARWWTFTIT